MRLGMMWTQRMASYAPLAALGTLAVGASVVLRRVDPNVPGNLLPPCVFYSLTGIYCPGCGSTRCLHALVHFDLPQAFSMNPLLVLSLVPMTLLALHIAHLLPAPLQGLAHFFAKPMPWAVVIISYSLLRNLPWYPFYLLAPG